MFWSSLVKRPTVFVEPLNHRHIGIHSVVPYRETVLLSEASLMCKMTIVEPLNKGHIGTHSVLPHREAVLISEVSLHTLRLSTVHSLSVI